MAKSSQDIEKEFIDGIKSSTGNNLQNWLKAIKASGIEKRNDLIKWLKEHQNFGHMNASLLIGIYLNNGKPVYGSSDDLLETQLSKYEEFRPLYEYVSKQILNEFPEARLIPKKTYLSFTAKREFAAINIKSKEIRLGMDLGDKSFDTTFEKAKLTGPMPRISHMVMIRDAHDFNQKVIEGLHESYNRVNS